MGDRGGVFVSRVDTQDWEADDEVGGLVHFLFEDGETAAGLWKPDPDGGPEVSGHELPSRETIVVLEGSVRIEIQGSETLELGRGAIVSMPKGAVTTWHPSRDFKEFWIYA